MSNHGLPIKDCRGNALSNVPHRNHEHPIVRVTNHHDVVREQISTILITAHSQIVALLVQHNAAAFPEVTQNLHLIGRMLDALDWESPDMIKYMAHQTTSQEQSMEQMSKLLAQGDLQALMLYGRSLEQAYPMPIITH